MSGKTDPQIVRDYLVEMGLRRDRRTLVEAVLRSVEGHLAAAAAAGRADRRRHRLPGRRPTCSPAWRPTLGWSRPS